MADPGRQHLRRVMAESQPAGELAAQAGREVDAKWPTRESDDAPQLANRKNKGNKGSGTIGTDEWNQNKYGGDGY